MPGAEALVRTDRPERYLAAEPAGLLMSVHPQTPEDLDRLQDVVARHLLRFATHDELSVDWTPAAA
jgi:hypothetical protein